MAARNRTAVKGRRGSRTRLARFAPPPPESTLTRDEEQAVEVDLA